MNIKRIATLSSAWLLIALWHAVDFFIDAEKILLTLETRPAGERVLRWIDKIMIEAIFIYGLRY